MRLRLVSVAALVLLVLAAGCSSDGKDGDAAKKSDDATTTTTAVVTTTTAKPPTGFSGGDLAAFCRGYREIQGLGYGEFKGSKEEQQAAIRAHYTKVGAAGKRMLAAAPKEIKHAVEVAMKINDEVVSQGSVAPFDSEENKKNGPLLAAYADAQCKGSS